MRKDREAMQDFVFYQIYPRSFLDSNGDGIGDLNGITSKLDYLKDLGINALWLSPCFKSPNRDNGYDIADYRDIMDEFGTMADWERMISEAHKRGVRLIMDLVANHTSDEHPWFRQARTSRGNPYHAYYYWSETPPNDWKSCFGGSAWEYNAPTKEYYLHSFAVQQPDLNWENPRVREEMRAIVDFWTDKGVDGFRCDVLDYISKDFNQGKMFNGPRLHEYIRELFGREKTAGLFTVGECQSNVRDIVDICGEGRGELSCVFQFEHFGVGRKEKFDRCDYRMDEIRDILVKWQNFTQENDLLYTLFTDNHDQAHYISRLGNDREWRYECATMYAAMFFLLKGIPFLYQGQEFGTPDPHYDHIRDFRDVETLNYYRENVGKVPESDLMAKINFGSRDNVRRPMAWNGEAHFGFGTGEPWISLHSRGEEVNLERDIASEKSVWRFYKALLKFRKENDAVRRGRFRDLTGQGKGYFVFERTYEGECVLVVCNFERKSSIPFCAEGKYRLILSNYGRRSRTVDGIYEPYETAVFKKLN